MGEARVLNFKEAFDLCENNGIKFVDEEFEQRMERDVDGVVAIIQPDDDSTGIAILTGLKWVEVI